MIRSLPTSNTYNRLFRLYVILYFIFLFAPLLVTCVLAFNNSDFPSLPWKGFTLDWFTANSEQRVGIFHDRINLDSIWVSFRVAFYVTLLSTAVGTCGAFLFEQEDFRFKHLLYFLMLAPLVIPGVILQLESGYRTVSARFLAGGAGSVFIHCHSGDPGGIGTAEEI